MIYKVSCYEAYIQQQTQVFLIHLIWELHKVTMERRVRELSVMLTADTGLRGGVSENTCVDAARRTLSYAVSSKRVVGLSDLANQPDLHAYGSWLAHLLRSDHDAVLKFSSSRGDGPSTCTCCNRAAESLDSGVAVISVFSLVKKWCIFNYIYLQRTRIFFFCAMVSHVMIPLSSEKYTAAMSVTCCIYNTVTIQSFNNDHDTNAACVTHSKQNYTTIVSVNTSNCNLNIKMKDVHT